MFVYIICQDQFILFATPDFKAFLKTTTNSHRNKHLIARGHTTMKKRVLKSSQNFKPVWMES